MNNKEENKENKSEEIPYAGSSNVLIKMKLPTTDEYVKTYELFEKSIKEIKKEEKKI